MKRTLIALAVALVTVQAQAQAFSSSRNVHGGFDYYDGAKYLGSSSANIHGGLDYFPSQRAYNYGYYGHGYGCCPSQDLVNYGVGFQGIGSMIRRLSGGNQ